MTKKPPRPKTIAPRLASGDSRVAFYLNLPDPVKSGIQSIAQFERKSASWVIETIIVEFFQFDVDYKERKGKWPSAKEKEEATSGGRSTRSRTRGSSRKREPRKARR